MNSRGSYICSDKIIKDGGCEVFTPSKQDFEYILSLCAKSGIRWIDGSFATDDTDIWDIYKERTIIVLGYIKGRLVLLYSDTEHGSRVMEISEFVNLYCVKCDVDVSDLL